MSSTYDGAVEISPALNAAEIKAYNQAVLELVTKAYKPNHTYVRRLKTLVEDALDFRTEVRMGLEVKTTEREVPEGTLLVRTSDRLSPIVTEYSTLVTPHALVELLRKTFPNHTLTGVITWVDDECHSAEKVTLHEGKVYAVKGVISVVWQDGSRPTPVADLA